MAPTAREVALELSPVDGQTARSALAEGTSTQRQARAAGSGKSWMLNGPQGEAPVNDAKQAGIDPAVALGIVRCVTKFATTMCVLVAIVKLCVYAYSQAAVVKTSALDSAGDLVANCITLYTGYKMNDHDPVTFPVGQSKFEPIGVLTFSTLMAATMFSNALNNFEDLIAEEETKREEAIDHFVDGMFGVHQYDEAENKHSWINMEDGYEKFKWSCLGNKKMTEPQIAAWCQKNQISSFMTGVFTAENWTMVKQAEAVRETIDNAAEVEDEALKASKLWFTVSFLACIASYKFCLWMYCKLVAIPRSGSTILVALANDKRNDFISGMFVVSSLIFANAYEEELGDWAEMIDPLSSLILSLVIIYTWVRLMFEQIIVLSAHSVAPEVLHPLHDTVHTLIRGTPLEIETVKCYHSGSKNVVEVSLIVTDAKKSFTTVDQTVSIIEEKLSAMEDVERVLVTTSRAM